jgi:hypothetical protein
MQYLTLKRVMSFNPCYDEVKLLEISGGRKRIRIEEVFDLDISSADKLWLLLREPIFTASELRHMACDFAESVLTHWYAVYSDDHRPRECIEITRRYADGKATDEELEAAREAAGEAAWAAAGAARAAWAAAGAAWAARDAAGAAWAAARDAWEAARAARAAAWEAAGAAWAAAWEAAQLEIVKKYWMAKNA